MIKFKIQRGDILKKIIALLIVLISLFGGMYIYKTVFKINSEAYVTITFDIDGTIIKKEVLRGNKVEEPNVPIKEGYTFIGWDNNASFDLVTKDEIYKAIYTINHYTITFRTNSETVIEPLTYEYGAQLAEFEIPIREGYEFVGWFYQGVLFSNETMPAYNVELTGVWYSTITFSNIEGIEFETLKGVPGELITAPIISFENMKDGEIIVWYKDHLFQEVYTFHRMPEESIKLYGRFEKIKNVDLGFLDNLIDNELPNIINNYQDLVDYLEYMVFHQITKEIELIINYEMDNTQSILKKALEDVMLDSIVEIKSYRKGNSLFVSLEIEEEATTKASLTDLYYQLENVENILENGRSPAFNDFAIEKLTNSYKVTNSEQLYYVVERGYKPIFDNDIDQINDTKKIYEEAKYILRNIISDNMTDYEKVHAIYDWLVINITYDKRLKDYISEDVDNLRKYRGLYLEGVFLDQRAVCDGIAKAFVLLCRIEGIEAIRVRGYTIDKSYAHAWNKVCINNMWYVVDVTNGGTIASDNELLNHNYLFTNDDFYGSKFVATTYTDFVAYGEYDIYQEMFFEYDGYQYDFNITSQNELNIIIKWYTTNFYENTTIDMRINFDYGESLDAALLEAIQYAGVSSILPITNYDGSFLENNTLLIKSFKK